VPPEHPTAGVRTFLITDIRGYTAYTVEHGDEAAAQLAERFASIVGVVVSAHEGSVVETRGDEVMAVFSSPRQGLAAGVELQRRIQDGSEAIPAGIGVDSGEAIPVGSGYRGAALNLAARLCAIAQAGEVLTTDGVVHLARRTPGILYEERGMAQLKGFADPVRVVRVVRETDVAAPSPDRSSSTETQPEPATQLKAAAGYLGARPAGGLVARVAELTALRDLLKHSQAGSGAVAILSGEPGIGKTRLAQALTLEAGDAGILVATGRCYEPQAAVPFYTFRELMATLYHAAPAATRAQVPHEWPFLSRILPDRAIPAADPAPTSHEEQQRLFAAVTGFVIAVSDQAPVAMFIDDLQWADPSSLQLTQHLARQTLGHPIFILGTYRDTDVDRNHPLQRAVVDLSREHILNRFTLRELTFGETAELVTDLLGSEASPEVVDLVYRRTDGSPFFVEELVKELRERTDIAHENGEWRIQERSSFDVPETVRMVIGQRLARLTVATQAILTEASVLGQTFDFDELRGVTDRSEEDLDEALDEATDAGLVKFLKGDRYTFNHGLTQQALYAELSPRRKRRLHQSAGEVVESMGEAVQTRRLAELAWHFQEAGDPRALDYSLRAGDQAQSLWALAEAKTHYDSALELAEESGSEADRARVRECLGGLATALIAYPEALASLEEAAAIYGRDGNLEAVARVVAQIGRVHNAAGSIGEGIVRLSQAVPALESASGPARAELHSSLARLLFVSDYASAAEHAQLAIDLLSGDEEPGGLRAEALVTCGASLAMMGHPARGEEYIRDGIAAARGAGDLFSDCRGSMHLAMLQVRRGDLDAALEALGRAVGLASQMANPRQVANALMALAFTEWLKGFESEAAAEALVIMRALGGYWFQPVSYSGIDISDAALPAMPIDLRQCLEIAAAR
jgi:class 3 adenylate cyclase/tetratricopeptide (TPR) repeat protein